ncbi:unnamed protein product [Oreochromis niloticus]|nr:unnamed protein product [Mustela putorius furo]
MSRGTITRGGQKRFCGESKSEDSGLGEKGVKTQGEEEEVSSLQKGKSEDSDLGEKSVPTPRENEEERFSEKVNSGDSGSYEWGSMHTDEVEVSGSKLVLIVHR